MAEDLDGYVGALDWIVVCAAAVSLVALVAILRRDQPPAAS